MHIYSTQLISLTPTSFDSHTIICTQTDIIVRHKIVVQVNALIIVNSDSGMRERTEGDWMHGEWTRKLHKISIYSPTNAHYYMTDIRLNCKFIISHNSIYIYYMLYVMFIPHEMILKIFQVIYYYFHNPYKSERARHTRVMSFIVCGAIHLTQLDAIHFYFFESHKYVFTIQSRK